MQFSPGSSYFTPKIWVNWQIIGHVASDLYPDNSGLNWNPNGRKEACWQAWIRFLQGKVLGILALLMKVL